MYILNKYIVMHSMVWNSIRELFQLIYDSTTTWR